MIRLALALLLLATPALAAEEHRDPAQVRHFRHDHPCPVTGRIRGACPGYVVDHVRPLCAGGPDRPANMQWQSRAEGLCKDRWERALCRAIRRGEPEPPEPVCHFAGKRPR